MFMVFEGTPGSGKSYDAVRKIMDNLCLKRTVYTNIDGMRSDECREMIKCVTGLGDFQLKNLLRFIPNSKVSDFYTDIELGSLIVIDEAQNYFNARNWKSQANEGFSRWASTHRHYGFDVVLITQDIARIDSAVRSLVEWTYRYKKLNFFGDLVRNKYMCHAYSGDASGKPLSRLTRSYDSKIFKCYQSYVTKDVKELGVMKHANILKHPIFYAIPVVLVAFLFLFFKSGFSKGNIIPGSNSIHQKQAQAQSGRDNQNHGKVVKTEYGHLADKRILIETFDSGFVRYTHIDTGKLLPDISIQYVKLDDQKNIAGKVKTEPVYGYSSPSGEPEKKSVQYSKHMKSDKDKFKILGLVNSGYNTSSYFMYQKDGELKTISFFDLDNFCDCDSVGKYRVGDLLDFEGL